MLVNIRKSEKQAVVTTGGRTINIKRSLKQLGVMIDDKLIHTTICRRCIVECTSGEPKR